MALKDIVVQLDTGNRCDAKLAAAIALARRHDAHLTALFVLDIPESAFFYGGAMPYASGGPDLVAQTRADLMDGAKRVEAKFREAVRREGLEGEWRVAEGETPVLLSLHARYADLTVVGQPADVGGAAGVGGAVCRLVRADRRPCAGGLECQQGGDAGGA